MSIRVLSLASTLLALVCVLPLNAASEEVGLTAPQTNEAVWGDYQQVLPPSYQIVWQDPNAVIADYPSVVLPLPASSDPLRQAVRDFGQSSGTGVAHSDESIERFAQAHRYANVGTFGLSQQNLADLWAGETVTYSDIGCAVVPRPGGRIDVLRQVYERDACLNCYEAPRPIDDPNIWTSDDVTARQYVGLDAPRQIGGQIVGTFYTDPDRDWLKDRNQELAELIAYIVDETHPDHLRLPELEETFGNLDERQEMQERIDYLQGILVE